MMTHHSPAAALFALHCQEGVVGSQIVPRAASMEGGTDMVTRHVFASWHVCDDAAKFCTCRACRAGSALKQG